MNITNKFDHLVQRVEKTAQNNHLAEKSRNLFKDKPFNERYSQIYLGARLTALLCNFLSAATASVFLIYIFKPTFVNLPPFLSNSLPFIFAALIVFILETLKRKSCELALIDIFRYKKIGLALLIGTVCTLLSIVSSWNGSKYIPTITTTPPPPPIETAFNGDSISKRHDLYIISKKDQIDSKQKQIKLFISNNLSSRTGKLSSARNVRRAYNDLNKELSILQKELSNALKNKEVELSNEKNIHSSKLKTKLAKYDMDVNNYENSTSKYINMLVWVSVSLEFLFWVSYTFVMFFLYKSFIEFNVLDADSNNSIQFENLDLEGLSTVLQPKKIGFNMINEPFKLINLGGVNLIEYKGKKYNEQQIRSNISANKSKARKYKLKNDIDKEKQYLSGANRWLKMLRMLKAD